MTIQRQVTMSPEDYDFMQTKKEMLRINRKLSLISLIGATGSFFSSGYFMFVGNADLAIFLMLAAIYFEIGYWAVNR